MKLSEKIYACRKKQGLSQEKLAEKLGVSRQAVSKWETGESEPEISKLNAIAQTFGVTVDWLLSDEEAAPMPSGKPEIPNWIESLPGTVGKLIRRYGWLAGGYLAFIGILTAGVGALARYLSMSMMPSGEFWGGPVKPNPVAIMGGFMIGLGLVISLTGVILAICLKKKSRK